MAAVGDIYEIVDKQLLSGQECNNVYFYRRTAPVLVGNPAQQVAEAYEGQVLPSVCAIQSGNLLHTEIIARNLFDVTDEFTLPVSEPGTLGGNNASPFDAVGFRLNQSNGAIKNGAKRYGGFLDENSAAGIINSPTFITLLLGLGGVLAAGIDIGIIGDALLPVIVKRILTAGQYRLPANAGEAVYGDIEEALYNVNTTTQNSRKIGRGD